MLVRQGRYGVDPPAVIHLVAGDDQALRERFTVYYDIRAAICRDYVTFILIIFCKFHS